MVVSAPLVNCVKKLLCMPMIDGHAAVRQRGFVYDLHHFWRVNYVIQSENTICITMSHVTGLHEPLWVMGASLECGR
jgi:hypothetical protein